MRRFAFCIGRLQQEAIVAHVGKIGSPQALAESRRNQLALVGAQTNAAALVDDATNKIEFAVPHEECLRVYRHASAEINLGSPLCAYFRDLPDSDAPPREAIFSGRCAEAS